MRKLRWAVAVLVAVALLAVVGVRTDWFGFQRDEAPATETMKVGGSGGTFTFPDGLKITVPKGAVPDGSTLKEAAPVSLKKGDGPFGSIRSAGVRFDVTILRADGTAIEPKKALVMDVPTQPGSAFLPDGARGMVLPYTPDETGKGFLLLPAAPVGKTVLRVTVAHLSPKYLAYISDDQLLRSFFPEKVLSNPGDCKQSVSVGGHKAKIGSESRGWWLGGDSAIYACLAAGPNGTVAVDIANRIDYILSVAATDNVRLAASGGGIDEELTKSTADVLFHKTHLRAYLLTDGKLVGATLPSDLPATIELQGDPNTFLAEATWRTLEFLVGFFTGVDGSAAAHVVNELLGKANVASCLQKAVDGKTLQNFGSGFDMIAGCLGVITDALYAKFNFLVIPELIVGMANNAWQSGIHFTNGIKLTLADTLRVQVVLDDPAPTCPSESDLERVSNQILQNGNSEWEAVKPLTNGLVCQNGWASNDVSIRSKADPGTVADIGLLMLLHWNGGSWVNADPSARLGTTPSCNGAPDKVKARIFC